MSRLTPEAQRALDAVRSEGAVRTQRERQPFDEQAAIRRAYMTLLELPHKALRLRLQSVLSTLRDEIAAGANQEPQFIQDSYEHWVAEHPSEFAR